MTAAPTVDRLDALELPIVDGRVDWDRLTTAQLHEVIRGAADRIGTLEPELPSDGVLQRSLMVEETARTLSPLQHRYAGLLKDAFDTPKLRATVDLPEGKTPFKDAKDLLAKTHDLRAFEATGRLRIAAAMTPTRASDPDRDEHVAVGETKLPLLGALQATGKLHPSKLSSALNMLTELDKNAADAGKDQAYRDRLRTLIEKDLVEKIEHTTPEEFGRYVSARKKDLLASIDPPDQKFTQAQTEAMWDARCLGPVRGNPDAHEWRLIASAEFTEIAQTLLSVITNPRGKDRTSEDDHAETKETEFDRRSTGHKRMQAFGDALKFALANLDKAEFRGASGAHAQMLVLADYPTLIQGMRDQLVDLLPEIKAEQREHLLGMLAQAHTTTDDAHEPIEDATTSAPNATGAAHAHPPDEGKGPPGSTTVNIGDQTVVIPPAKTTNVDELFDDDNLDRLQPRISQGVFTPYIPPQVLLRMLCDVDAVPITLTGQREVLSIGRQQRQFTPALRRAILARDRGCAVPGCHWPAAWCELHHIKYWSRNGETSTDNGITLCSHHHQALHAKMLQIERVNGEIRFRLHPLIDPAQEPRKNYFWQA